MQKVGEFEISRVVESEVPFIEPSVFLPDFTPDAFEANKDWLLPRYADAATGKLIFSFQSYIVRSPRYTILVDTCVGNDKPRLWDRSCARVRPVASAAASEFGTLCPGDGRPRTG